MSSEARRVTIKINERKSLNESRQKFINEVLANEERRKIVLEGFKKYYGREPLNEAELNNFIGKAWNKVKNVGKGITNIAKGSFGFGGGAQGHGGSLQAGQHVYDYEKRTNNINTANQQLEALLQTYPDLTNLHRGLTKQNFPNDKDYGIFKQYVQKIKQTYDGIVTDQKLSVDQKNQKIAVLRDIVLFYQDYKTDERYVTFTGKDKGGQAQGLEPDAGGSPEDLEADRQRLMGSQAIDEAEEGAVSKNYQGYYSWKAPIVFAVTGLAMLGLGKSNWLKQITERLKDIEDVSTSSISTTITRLAVKPGEGITQVLERITGGDLGPNASIENFKNPLYKPLLTVLKKALIKPDGARLIDNLMNGDTGGASDTLGNFLRGQYSGRAKEAGDLLGINQGRFQAAISDVITSTSSMESNTLKNALLNAAPWAATALGAGLLAAAVATAGLRAKGKYGGSRMAEMKALVDLMKDVKPDGSKDPATEIPKHFDPTDNAPATAPAAAPTAPSPASPPAPEVNKDAAQKRYVVFKQNIQNIKKNMAAIANTVFQTVNKPSKALSEEDSLEEQLPDQSIPASHSTIDFPNRTDKDMQAQNRRALSPGLTAFRLGIEREMNAFLNAVTLDEFISAYTAVVQKNFKNPNDVAKALRSFRMLQEVEMNLDQVQKTEYELVDALLRNKGKGGLTKFYLDLLEKPEIKNKFNPNEFSSIRSSLKMALNSVVSQQVVQNIANRVMDPNTSKASKGFIRPNNPDGTPNNSYQTPAAQRQTSVKRQGTGKFHNYAKVNPNEPQPLRETLERWRELAGITPLKG